MTVMINVARIKRTEFGSGDVKVERLLPGLAAKGEIVEHQPLLIGKATCEIGKGSSDSVRKRELLKVVRRIVSALDQQTAHDWRLRQRSSKALCRTA